MNPNKQKARFNLIDAIIVFIILLVIGAAIYLVITNYETSKEAKIGNIEFVVRLSAVEESALPLITEGTTVKDSVSGTVLGTIRRVEHEKTRHYSSNAVESENGYTLSVSEYDTKYDVFVTISSHANADDHGVYTVGKTRILVGSTVYFKIPSFTQISFITETFPAETDLTD